MKKKRKDADQEATSGWIEDEEFAHFFKEFIEDSYDPEADEELKTFITYKALYTMYVRTIDARAGVKALDKEFSVMSDSLFRIDEAMRLLLNVITVQAEKNRTVGLFIRVLSVLAIIQFLVLGYFVYCLVWNGASFPYTGIGG